MSRAVRGYIRVVDAMNRFIGRFAMYLIFVLVGVLLWSTISKLLSYTSAGITPANWTLETAQFVMVAYYILGGPYSIQLGSNVRMDLFYGGWSPKQKAWMDAFTVMFLLYYLGVLLYGAVGSLSYSLGAHYELGRWEFFGQLIWSFLTGGPSGASEHIGRLEITGSAWRPVLWPLKTVVLFGLVIMILQALSEFFKDLIRIRGGEA